MITDPELRAQIYGYFCEEARELLSKIEMDLMRLSQEGDRRVTVHELMRATHTLKGSAASIGLDTIQEIAHLLEDVFKNLYDPTIPLDAELMQLLLQGYDYLQESLNKEFSQPGQGDDPELLSRATALLRRLQVKLGSNLDSTSVPTSTELGLDYVHSVFAESVRLRLDELADLITRADTQMVLGAEFLTAMQSHLEVFEGLGISLNLLGFSAIAGTALKALEQHPQRIRDIASLALSDLKAGQQQVLAGDRTQGGTLSVAWQSFLPSVGTESLEAAIDRALFLVSPAPVGDEPLSLAELMSPDPVLSEPPASLAVVPSPTPKPSAPPMVRLEVEILDRLHQTVGDVLVQQQKDLREVKQLLGQLHTLQDQQESLRHVVQQLQDWQERPAFTTLLAKAQAALSDLERSVDALATTAHRTQHLHEQRQQMLIHMHDNLMSARMQPLDDIFNRFWTTVEQLSVKFNKQVGLKITGGDLLVDRAIAAKLYDPLLHLVRNAFDHGIEPPPQRQSLGKPLTGTIELNAYRHGGRTVIEVRDDGAGIDPQKIRQRAIERNLFAPLAAYNLSAAELLELLFEPGFSTAPQVSELSGRGIGLDVVRSQMQSINGETAVASTPSQGTTFSLILPITLSTARVLLVECQGRTYGLISDTVERVLQPPLTQRVCFWDHEAIPIRALSELLVYHSPLAATSTTTEPSSALEQRQLLIVLSAHTQRLAIAVDRVIGEQESVISPLGTEITAPSYICGSGMAPSGQPYLILDGTILVEGLPLYASAME